jgi:hypothetical protein
MSETGYWNLVEPYWEAVNIYDGPSDFARTFREVPPSVQPLIAAHWCESEVSNGGLHQFFSNSTGVLAPEAAQAFRVLGVDLLATVLEEAMAFFGPNYPRDQDERCAALPEPDGRPREEWDPFFALDERFYEAAGYRGGGVSKDRLFLAMDVHARKASEQ